MAESIIIVVFLLFIAVGSAAWTCKEIDKEASKMHRRAGDKSTQAAHHDARLHHKH